MLVLGLDDGLKNPEIMEGGVTFKIMKSGLYCTKSKQKKTVKRLKVLFKYMFTIFAQKNTIILTIFVPMIFL